MDSLFYEDDLAAHKAMVEAWSRGGKHMSYNHICPECHGMGFNRKDEICPLCAGYGQVSPEAFDDWNRAVIEGQPLGTGSRPSWFPIYGQGTKT